MKSVSEWDISDLEILCKDKTEETTSLEFKRSDSLLSLTASRKEEMCKDVSAMANAAGGVIIFGIAETEKGEADYVDTGCSASDMSSERIDQILSSGIEPRLCNLAIHQITLASGNRCFVLDIPQATVFAPHQARGQKRYYKRTDKRVEAMLDFEIRDVFRRAVTPSLFLQFTSKVHEGIVEVSINIGNHSNEPALYSIVELFFEKKLGIERIDGLEKIGGTVDITLGNIQYPADRFTAKMTPSGHFPIFREASFLLCRFQMLPEINIPSLFFYQIMCPGFKLSQGGNIVFDGESVLIRYDKPSNG